MSLLVIGCQISKRIRSSLLGLDGCSSVLKKEDSKQDISSSSSSRLEMIMVPLSSSLSLTLLSSLSIGAMLDASPLIESHWQDWRVGMDDVSIGSAQLTEWNEGLLLSVTVSVYAGSTWVGSVLEGLSIAVPVYAGSIWVGSVLEGSPIPA